MTYISASRRAWSRLDSYAGPKPIPSERLISVTSLVAPPRIARLKSLNRASLPSQEPRYVNGKLQTPDTKALVGTAVHAALAEAARHADPPCILIEERMEATVTVEGCLWTVSGQLDVLEHDLTLIDWKNTSAYQVSDGRKGKSEWETQLNVLSWLLVRNGYQRPKRLLNWGIFGDWSRKIAARSENDYPEDDECPVEAAHWSYEEQTDYVQARLRLHEAARHSLPDCTPEERWAKDAGWAVLASSKAPRAAAVYDNRETAERYLREVRGGKGVLEYRPGTSNRCASFCIVSAFCEQWKKELDKR